MKIVLTLQSKFWCCAGMCHAVKRESGENPGQTTLL